MFIHKKIQHYKSNFNLLHSLKTIYIYLNHLGNFFLFHHQIVQILFI